MIISNKKIKTALDFAGRCLHSPEQRIILGATALATQPFIDLNNKSIDKETRMTSVARTLAKIIAGTLVGVAVRVGGIAFVKANSRYVPIFKDVGQKVVRGIVPHPKKGLLVPDFMKKPFAETTLAQVEKNFQQYRKNMGTLLATVAMVFTNFLLDAPLTKYFTNVFNKMLKPEPKTKTQEAKK